MGFKLITLNNHKIQKAKAFGYLNAILHLAPARLSGFNVCPKSSAGCRAACLYTAGFGVYSNVQAARVRKTRLLYEKPEAFRSMLRADIAALVRAAKRQGLTPAVRLNGTSDIVWEKKFPEIFAEFPNLQFYDYTKLSHRLAASYHLPANYHLTFSASENNWPECRAALERGFNVAMVFSGVMPEWYNGYAVIDGDINDLRFLDVNPCIVGLSPKGRARRDVSGFVHTAENSPA